jgi:hypothetical protein
VINEIKNGKENFLSIPITTNLKDSLTSYFAKEISKNQTKEITIIPDKQLAEFDFDSLNIDNEKLANLVTLNYAFTMRQVNPATHKNIQLTHIITHYRRKRDSRKLENGRLLETKNTKKLGPLLNDSDILNTKINYANGNIFSPSSKRLSQSKRICREKKQVFLS